MMSLRLGKGPKIIVAGMALLAMAYLFISFQRNNSLFNEALDLKQRKLDKYRQTVQEKKVVEEEILRLQRTFKQAESVLLRGKTEPLAAAEIQQIVTGITKRVPLRKVFSRSRASLTMPLNESSRCSIKFWDCKTTK